MLLGLAGVSGVGKSFFKDKLVEKLNFEKIKIITTRQKRITEKNNEDKIFVTNKELITLRNSNKLAYEFNMLGNNYAYTYAELFSSKNTVFELHYNTIYDFKKICPNLCSIYILPNNIETPKEQIKKRHLDSDTEKKRLLEIDEHYNNILSNENLKNQFNYFFKNNYDKESENRFISLIKKLINT